eukprot:CAMPEP_0172717426 /NCGR_PEP_ID=MMETSP1074-20121228/71405_1 /TAXON_ID=2916 /ORGANISM="Ceratium fusus, Strain PA161109" /LENGTH=46 /DNA_ID= /DNA_START= /DNA_END= /DNA_ORIENTATION=
MFARADATEPLGAPMLAGNATSSTGQTQRLEDQGLKCPKLPAILCN